MSDALELTNVSPRSIEYAWIDMLEDDDRALVDSLYLWATYANMDGDTNLAEDLRKAAKRIGDLAPDGVRTMMITIRETAHTRLQAVNKMISKITKGMDRTLHETDGVGLQFMLDQVELILGLKEDLINLPPRTPREASEGDT